MRFAKHRTHLFLYPAKGFWPTLVQGGSRFEQHRGVVGLEGRCPGGPHVSMLSPAGAHPGQGPPGYSRLAGPGLLLGVGQPLR